MLLFRIPPVPPQTCAVSPPYYHNLSSSIILILHSSASSKRFWSPVCIEMFWTFWDTEWLRTQRMVEKKNKLVLVKLLKQRSRCRSLMFIVIRCHSSHSFFLTDICGHQWRTPHATIMFERVWKALKGTDKHQTPQKFNMHFWGWQVRCFIFLFKPSQNCNILFLGSCL